MEYPRLLIVSGSAFNRLSGGGITFTNLFHGWPKDSIATVTNDPIKPSTDVCEKYYFLSRQEFPWVFPFSLVNILQGGQEHIEKNLKTRPHGGLDLLKRSVQRIFGGELPADAVLSEPLKEWIREFRPQALYTILGNLPYIRLVRLIANEFRLPVVLHIMDDWPKVSYHRGILGRLRRARMDIELREIIRDAAACLGICEAMCDEYKKRYSREFLPFANALPSEKWKTKARTNWKSMEMLKIDVMRENKESPPEPYYLYGDKATTQLTKQNAIFRRFLNPFKILYGGALMENSQVKSVIDIAEIIPRLRNGGLDIEFNIYAPFYAANRYRGELEKNAGVKVFDMPETMDIESLFSGADLLLLPVNFDEESVNYIRYSMPTKVPAYMFSGTPTLAYGPSKVASIQYAKQWAYCVTERNQEKLCEAIKKLAADETLRETLGKNAGNLAEKRHDRAKVSLEFQEILSKVVKIETHFLLLYNIMLLFTTALPL